MPRLSKRVKALVTENMRSIILETSEKIIIRDGLDKLSIKQLAEEAGISTGSIYSYFKNKEEIISGIMRTTFQNLLGNLKKISNMDSSASEKLYEMAFFMFEAFPRVRRLHEALRHRQYPAHNNGMKHPGHKKLMDILTGTIKQGIKDGDFTDCDPEFSALAFWGIILEIQMNPGSLFSDTKPEVLADKVMKTLLRGIRI